MNQRYLAQWTEIAKHVQKPFQEMLELNVKALRNFKFLKPEDLVTLKYPEELVEKQVNFAIENGHEVLDYLQQSFAIFEQILQPLTETEKNTAATVKTEVNTWLDPTGFAMLPTKTAIDMVNPLFDPISDTFDPRKALIELGNVSFTSKTFGAKSKKIKKSKRH